MSPPTVVVTTVLMLAGIAGLLSHWWNRRSLSPAAAACRQAFNADAESAYALYRCILRAPELTLP